jgi:zinc protease
MKPAAAPTALPESLEALLAEAPEQLALDNGLTLVCQRKPEHPLISAQVWVRTGSIHEVERPGSGLSHFLEHMLFKGTVKRGPGAIAAEVQAFGGQVNAYTAFDRTVYTIDGPAEALARSLDILCDMTLHATLPEDQVEKEKQVILREIDMTLDDPDRILIRALFATAFREHPFRYPVIGLRPLFQQVDRAILAAYYNARYRPENMVLSVVGDFDRESLLEQVNATFGQAPHTPLAHVRVPDEPRQLALRETRLTGDYQSARGVLGYKIPSMRDDDAPALDVLGAILGAGHSGRLRQLLREERNLVHHVSASTWNPGDPGLFFIQYQCAPDKAAAAEDAIRKVFAGLGESGFNAQELEKARRFAFVSEVQAHQTTSGLAARLGLVSALVGDLNYPRSYFAKLYALTPEDLRALAARIFSPDRLTLASLLPKATEARLRPKPAAAPLPAFEMRLLPNGARLLWQRDPRLPRTWMRFTGLGGPLYEPQGLQGATSLLTTLLARDTARRSAREVSDDLESNGGFMSDASGNNSFALAVEVIPEMATAGLQALREAILEPAFKPQTLEREREAQLAHLRELDDDILDCGRIALRRHFFGKHPFASDPCGTHESTSRLDEAAMRQLYNELVVAANSVLVVAGDFDPDQLLDAAEAFLAELPARPLQRRQPPFSGPASTGDIRQYLAREQSVVFEAYPDCGFRPDASLAGELLDELLSDMSGPLFRAVREDRSLAYFVGAARLLAADYGAFHLYAGAQPGTADQVYACFDAELERIRSGKVSEAEVAAARTRLKVSNRFSLQSPAARAGRAGLNVLFGKPVMDWLDYEQRLDALSAEDLTAFANTWLQPDRRLRLVIGPEND